MPSNRTYNISAVLLGLTGILLIAYGVFLFLTPEIIIRWSTATELETAGFNIYRSTEREGDYERISDNLITASPDPLSGGDYQFVDDDVRSGQTYYYMLQEVEVSGNTNPEGPIEARAAYRGIAETLLGLVLVVFAIFTRRLAVRNRSLNSHEPPGP